MVVDNDCGTEALQQPEVAGGRGGDDVVAGIPDELDGVHAHARGTAEDKNGLGTFWSPRGWNSEGEVVSFEQSGGGGRDRERKHSGLGERDRVGQGRAQLASIDHASQSVTLTRADCQRRRRPCASAGCTLPRPPLTNGCVVDACCSHRAAAARRAAPARVSSAHRMCLRRLSTLGSRRRARPD